MRAFFREGAEAIVPPHDENRALRKSAHSETGEKQPTTFYCLAITNEWSLSQLM